MATPERSIRQIPDLIELTHPPPIVHAIKQSEPNLFGCGKPVDAFGNPL
jgi:hypothetical protein